MPNYNEEGKTSLLLTFSIKAPDLNKKSCVLFLNPRTRSPRSWTTSCPIRTRCWLRSHNWRMPSLKLRYGHLSLLCHKRKAGVWCAEWLSVCMNAGEQRISQRAALSLREGDNGVADRAADNAGPGSGKLTAEKGRGFGQSGGWKTEPAGARRLDGFRSRAAQRKWPIELCARSQNNTQQVGWLTPPYYLLIVLMSFPKIRKHWTVISLSGRLAQSIESMQRFSLSADPSFRHFQLDVSRELKLLTDLNFIQGRKGNKWSPAFYKILLTNS